MNTNRTLLALVALTGIIAIGGYFLWPNKIQVINKSENPAKDTPQTIKPSNISKKTLPEKIDIHIQPLGDFSQAYTQEVATRLKAMYSGNVIVNSPKPLPNNARNKTKTRYRADSLLIYLNAQTRDENLTIGLTNKDISHTKRNESGDILVDDWGIMGLGYQPGKSCVASTHRLKGHNQLEKLFKVAIHELGHTQGLKHCPVKGCLMMDANGKDHFDELEGFCAKCKAVLIGAGWNLN
jgi:archaemetzincin